MKQPPILGRPATKATTRDGSGDSLDAFQAASDEERRTLRAGLLVTAGTAAVVLAICNGLLLLLYRHSSLGVVVTLGTFLAGGALTWLRRRSRQLTAVVLGVQGLLAVSAGVGALVALRAGLANGVLAGGVTFAGLTVLSVLGFLHVTGVPTAASRRLTWAGVVGVLAAMVCGYVVLLWGDSAPGSHRPYREPARDAVYWLIEDGQTYPGHDDESVQAAFEHYTCPSARAAIAETLAQAQAAGYRIESPENLRERPAEDNQARVTADITIVDENNTIVRGPQTWTFHLEQDPGGGHWRVCRIERPD